MKIDKDFERAQEEFTEMAVAVSIWALANGIPEHVLKDMLYKTIDDTIEKVKKHNDEFINS